MGRRLFGTDGVRGVAGVEITAQLALALGRAAVLHSGLAAPRALVIRDTRESGEMLEAALAAGLASAGADVALGGVLPTPAAPLLVRRHGFDLAAVISASHNPYADNGIKFFGGDGFKLSDETEREIELHIDEDVGGGGDQIGRIARDARDRRATTSRALQRAVRRPLARRARRRARLRQRRDLRGRAGDLPAPRRERHARSHAQPDGRNINDDCGSTHVDVAGRAVREGGHDVGFAFDGDGDRVLAVDRDGAIVDGDELLALAALHLHARGRLAGGGVVVTVMTNFGFHSAMAAAGHRRRHDGGR